MKQFYLYARYLLFIFIGAVMTACGGGNCATNQINAGTLSLSPSLGITLNIGKTESVVLALNDSKNVSNLVVSLNSSNPEIAIVSPDSCTLSTINNTCVLTVTGVSVAKTTILASADSYTTATESVIVRNYVPTAYLSDSDDGLLLYNIASNGALSYRGVAPVPTGMAPSWAPFGNVVTYNGYLYSADNTNGAVWIYMISDDGSLTYIESAPLPTSVNSWSPYSIVFKGTNAYIGDWNDDHIWRYTVNLANGSLSYVNEQPYQNLVQAGINPFNLTINGSYLYVSASNWNNSGSVMRYSIDNNANLSFIESIPLPNVLTGWSPEAVVFNNGYAYIASYEDFSNDSSGANAYGGSVWQYQVNNDGSLINPESQVMPSGVSYWLPDALTINQGTLYMGDDSIYQYDQIPNYGNVNVYSINSQNGKLQFSESTPFPNGQQNMDTYGIAFH